MADLKYLLTVEVDRKLSDNELTDSSFDGPKVCEAWTTVSQNQREEPDYKQGGFCQICEA